MVATQNSHFPFVPVFYQCFIQRLMCLSFICWFHRLPLKDKNCLNSTFKEILVWNQQISILWSSIWGWNYSAGISVSLINLKNAHAFCNSATITLQAIFPPFVFFCKSSCLMVIPVFYVEEMLQTNSCQGSQFTLKVLITYIYSNLPWT